MCRGSRASLRRSGVREPREHELTPAREVQSSRHLQCRHRAAGRGSAWVAPAADLGRPTTRSPVGMHAHRGRGRSPALPGRAPQRAQPRRAATLVGVAVSVAVDHRRQLGSDPGSVAQRLRAALAQRRPRVMSRGIRQVAIASPPSTRAAASGSAPHVVLGGRGDVSRPAGSAHDHDVRHASRQLRLGSEQEGKVGERCDRDDRDRPRGLGREQLRERADRRAQVRVTARRWRGAAAESVDA